MKFKDFVFGAEFWLGCFCIAVSLTCLIIMTGSLIISSINDSLIVFDFNIYGERIPELFITLVALLGVPIIFKDLYTKVINKYST